MKNRRKWIWITFALVVLGAAAFWWSNRPVPSSENPAHSNNKPPSATSAVVSPPPAPARSEPANTPDTGASRQKKFADMSARESRAILEEIRKLDFASIMSAWLDAGRVEHDPTKQSSIVSIWSTAMREKKPSLEVYENMKAFIADRSNSGFERGQLIGVLAAAATKEAAGLLIYQATTQTEKELKDSAISSISNLGGGGSREYLPPMIEPLWRESNDAKLLKAVAIAMAQEGAPSCIELLLPAAAAPDGQDDVRRDAAVWALTKVYTKNAVPPLAAALDANPLGSRTHTLAFTTLTQLFDETAALALMRWLQAADSRAAPLASQWIAQARHIPQLQAAEAALNPAVPFRSEQNREAIRAGLAAYRAGHTLQR